MQEKKPNTSKPKTPKSKTPKPKTPKPKTHTATVSNATAFGDSVNHPAHYGGEDNPYEVIKVLEAWGLEKDAYLFNVVKYLARAGKKDPAKDLEDHEKALWYLQRKIGRMRLTKGLK